MSLELDDASHRYVPDGPAVLDHITLRVEPGQLVGLAGASGSGKSTLLAAAGLMLRPDSGTIRLAGREVPARGRIPAALRRQLGFLPQSPRAFSDPRLSLAALITAPLAWRDGLLRPRPARYAQRLEALAAQARVDPELLGRRPGQVSDGQLQRALLGRALALDPAVLLCDEPTAALDPDTTRQIFAVLRAKADDGAAVLIASHDLASLKEVCDRVLSMEQLQRTQAQDAVAGGARR